MTTTWAFDRNKFCTTVLQRVRNIEPGQPPKAEPLAVVQDALDMVLKELTAGGTLWWSVSGTATSSAVSSVTGKATMPTDFFMPVSAAINMGDGDVPLRIIGHQEYQAIQDKTLAGDSELVFFSGLTATVHPIPASGNLIVTYERVLSDVERSGALDFPPWATNALLRIVTAYVADIFGVDESVIRRFAVEADRAKQDIRKFSSQKNGNKTVRAEYF